MESGGALGGSGEQLGAEGKGVTMAALWGGGVVLAASGACRSWLGLEVSAVWGEGVMMTALWGGGVVLAASGREFRPGARAEKRGSSAVRPAEGSS